jgi:2-polyprenyl-3-methyl-5-hydroxy-6-metoxy-1,4-benzoquinol methylase
MKSVVDIKEDLRKKILNSLKGDYKGNVVLSINHKDEMYLYGSGRGKVSDEDAFMTYFRIGERILDSLVMALVNAQKPGAPWWGDGTVLDFASGYGRCTRFLTKKFGWENKVTVSDIDPMAVDFNIKSFGVKGFYSTKLADDLKHDEKYDTIFVCSLFTHLSLEHWKQWYKKIYSLLSPNGTLVFSTHGLHLRPAEDRTNFDFTEAGFLFAKRNETKGRLKGDYYGSTFVSREFVSNFVRQSGCGDLVKYYRKGLCDFHDLYVIKNKLQK